MILYARKLVLRNCGRFTVVQSDFGADYRTHTHVTSEALYASLTRGITWRPQPIIIKNDVYNFARDYDLVALPIWFTPGVFLKTTDNHSSLSEEIDSYRLPQKELDTGYFNVLHEVYPTTSKSYGFDRKSGELKEQGRPFHAPSFGTWQGILPDRRMITYVFASQREYLEQFANQQTYLMGKKRTMMQIVQIGEIMLGQLRQGHFPTPFLQINPKDVIRFQSFEVLAGTVRYLILRGEVQPNTDYFCFNETLSLPTFVIPSYLGGD